MDYETLFPGRFLKGADLKGETTAEIKSIVGEEIDGKFKAIISFVGAKKQFVCNRTNAEAIKLMLGRETNGWIGKRITLAGVKMADPFSSDGAEVCALRVIGSPEIDKPMSAEVKRGRKTLNIRVRPTGKAAPKSGNGKPAGAVQKPAEAAPAPSSPTPEMTDEEKAEILARENAAGGDHPF